MHLRFSNSLRFMLEFLGFGLRREEIEISDRLSLSKYADRSGTPRRFCIRRFKYNDKRLDRRDALKCIDFPPPEGSFRHILSPSAETYHQSLGVLTWSWSNAGQYLIAQHEGFCFFLTVEEAAVLEEKLFVRL